MPLPQQQLPVPREQLSRGRVLNWLASNAKTEQHIPVRGKNGALMHYFRSISMSNWVSPGLHIKLGLGLALLTHLKLFAIQYVELQSTALLEAFDERAQLIAIISQRCAARDAHKATASTARAADWRAVCARCHGASPARTRRGGTGLLPWRTCRNAHKQDANPSSLNPSRDRICYAQYDTAAPRPLGRRIHLLRTSVTHSARARSTSDTSGLSPCRRRSPRPSSTCWSLMPQTRWISCT
mmetsp:Transcript_35661/g.79207  ORF Transcript_35661/g.79207 Transcript_35661/m.79207 type:complete len:240 (-) Transcript_35661:135-854(-)